MRKIVIASVTALLCAAAFPAVAAPVNDAAAQEQAQNNQSTQQPRARDASRRTCIRQTMSNSRLAQRVCHTQAEWDEMRRTGDLVDER
jgi:hypothetical protein